MEDYFKKMLGQIITDVSNVSVKAKNSSNLNSTTNTRRQDLAVTEESGEEGESESEEDEETEEEKRWTLNWLISTYFILPFKRSI